MPKPSYVKFDVPKELSDAAYEALQMAKTTGNVRKGTNETTKAVEKGSVKLVLIAEDVEPPEIVVHLPLLCDERNIPYIFVPSKSKLGSAAGINVSAASCCIVDAGDAESLVNEIVAKLGSIRKK